MTFFASFARRFVRATASTCLLAAAVLLVTPARAQDAPPDPSPEAEPGAPFSTLSLRAGGSAVMSSGLLERFYHISPGFELSFSTPFYAGAVGLEAGVRRFEGRDGVPTGGTLWTVPVALHWGVQPRLDGGRGPGGMRAEAALRVGTLRMHSTDPRRGLRNESELMMGAGAGLSVPLGGRWRLGGGVRLDHVFTSTPFSLWQARVDLRYRFDAPRWLQRFFR